MSALTSQLTFVLQFEIDTIRIFQGQENSFQDHYSLNTEHIVIKIYMNRTSWHSPDLRLQHGRDGPRQVDGDGLNSLHLILHLVPGPLTPLQADQDGLLLPGAELR